MRFKMIGTKKRRSGTTLFEILLVLAILGVLFSLLLVAIHKIRSISLRAECSVRLKNIGLALLTHNTTRGSFPPGLANPESGDPFPFMGWCARISPFLEREDIWKEASEAFAAEKNFLVDPPHSLLYRKIPQFACPGGSEPAFDRPGFAHYGFGWYLGVSGNQTLKSTNGVLFLNSAVRPEDILDGTTNTMMVGERPPGAGGDLGWWYAGWGQQKEGSGEMVLSVRESNVHYPTCPYGPFEYVKRAGSRCDSFQFWSHHPGGSHFLFADGSIRLIGYGSDAALFSLASRAGSANESTSPELR